MLSDTKYHKMGNSGGKGGNDGGAGGGGGWFGGAGGDGGNKGNQKVCRPKQYMNDCLQREYVKNIDEFYDEN